MLCWHLQHWSLHCCCCWSDIMADYRLHVDCHCPAQVSTLLGHVTLSTGQVVVVSVHCPLAVSTVHSTPPLDGKLGYKHLFSPRPAQPMFTPPPVFGQWCVVPTVLPSQCPVSSPHNPGKLDTSTRHSSRVAPRITPPPTDGHWRAQHRASRAIIFRSHHIAITLFALNGKQLNDNPNV